MLVSIEASFQTELLNQMSEKSKQEIIKKVLLTRFFESVLVPETFAVPSPDVDRVLYRSEVMVITKEQFDDLNKFVLSILPAYKATEFREILTNLINR